MYTKNSMLSFLLAACIINHTPTQTEAFTKTVPLSFATSLAAVTVMTAWDYATGKTEESAFIGDTTFKKVLRRLKHNIIYIGIPTGIVTSSLLYASGIQTEQVSNLFWPSMGKKTANMLPSFLKKIIVSVDTQGNAVLNGTKETVANFTKEYGSTIKDNFHTVGVHVLGNMVYVSKEVALIIKDALF